MKVSRTSLLMLFAMMSGIAWYTRYPADPVLFLVAGLGLLGALSVTWLQAETVCVRLYVLFPAGALLLLVAAYALNPTHEIITGAGLWPIEQRVPGLMGSAHAEASWYAFVVLSGGLAVFLLAAVLSRRDLCLAMSLTLLAGVAMAAWVVQDRLMLRPHPMHEWTGLFVSRNHFAAFANLLLPVAWVMGMRRRYMALESGNVSSPAGLFFVAAGLLAGAVILCGSRMGVAMTLLASAACGALHFWIKRKYEHVYPSSVRLSPMATAGLLLLAGCAVMAFLVSMYGAKWPGTRDWAFRWTILSDVLAVWRDNVWWGTGPGSFGSVFPYYQSEALADVDVLHAHHDALQFLSEFGLLGGLICIVAAVFLCKGAQRMAPGIHQRTPRFSELERWGLIIGVATVVLHSLVDFPFHAPLIYWTALLWLGLICHPCRKRSVMP